MSDPEIDSKFARDAWIRALERSARIEADPHGTLPVLIERSRREGDVTRAGGRARALSTTSSSRCARTNTRAGDFRRA